MFSVTKTPNPPHLKRIEMNCDDPITDKEIHPLPNTCFRMIVVGPPGSSKTSTSTAMLIKGGAYFKAFDKLYVVQPPNSRASYAKDPWDGHNRVYDELTVDNLRKILAEVKTTAAQTDPKSGAAKNSCIFIDDQAYQFKDKNIEKLLRESFFNSRHLHLSLIIVSQTLRSIPNHLRKSASHLLTFEPANRLEAKIIAEEFLFLDPSVASLLFEQVFQKRFDHLLVDTQRRKVFGNWHEIVLPRSF